MPRTLPSSSVRLLRTALVAAGLLLATSALAGPEGEQVVEGDVTFHRDGRVTVIRASDGAIIEYDRFDVFAEEVVEFVQPGADARVLNRVFGEATRIEGSLLANGIVYIVNPAGIFLDGDAVVDVGGLVAAAGHISDEDFLAGVDRFALSGPVVNEASVEASDVALLGTRVANLGRIEAPEGTIALVAGDRVVLTRLLGRIHVEVDGPPETATGDAGVTQAGVADAAGGQVVFAVGDHYSLALNHQGVTRGRDVLLEGGAAGLLLVGGEIDASDAGRGGRIDVTGDRVALVGARLDASGGTGGGSIRVGGARRGEGPLANARRTFVDSRSELVADAVGTGDGGSVIVWGDEAASMGGRISARGGAAGGDGGFAEVSSPGALHYAGTVDLGAVAGRAGTLLFDPQEIVLLGGSADGSDDPNAQPDELAGDDDTLGRVLFGDVGDGSTPFEIYESEIEGTDANVVLEATHGVTASGTFDNDAAGEGVGVVFVGGTNDLTIRTRNDTGDEVGATLAAGIDLGAIDWLVEGGDVLVETGAGDDATTTVADLVIGDVTTLSGDLAVDTTNGSIVVGDVDTSGASGGVGVNGGAVTITAGGAGRTATVGDVLTTGGDGSNGLGGQGGATAVTTEDGSILLGSVDTSGGDGAIGSAASAGGITVAAGTAEGGSGSIDVGGPLVAVDGTGGLGTPQANDRVDLEANGGAVEFDPGVAGPQITTTEEVRLAGATVGAVTPIEIEAVSTAVSPFFGRRTLTVEASDTADVGVTDTASFDALVAVARSAAADIDVVQAGGSQIDIDGGVGTSTITSISTSDDSLAGGIAVTVRLEDELEGGLDESLDLAVGTGAITTNGGVTLQSEDDIVLGADAVAVDPFPGVADTDWGLLRLQADADLDGDGAIAVSAPGPHLSTGGDVSLAGFSVGVGGPLEIDAQAVPDEAPPPNDPFASRRLELRAAGTADVAVTGGGFGSIVAILDSAEADIDLVHGGGGRPGDPGAPSVVLDVDGAPGVATVAQLLSDDAAVPGGVSVQLELTGATYGDPADDVDLAIAAGAVEMGGGATLIVGSEDDVVLGDDAIRLTAPDGVEPGFLVLSGDVDRDGAGSIETTGGAGPHVTAESFVQLTGVSIGALGTVVLDAVEIPDTAPPAAFAGRNLLLQWSDVADVEVAGGAFDGIVLDAGAAEASLDLVQVGGGTPVDPGVRIDVDGAPGTSTLTALDSRDAAVPGGVSVRLTLADDLVGAEDLDLDLSVAAGAVSAGGSLVLRSEDDVVLGDGAIAMNAPDPLDPAQVADLQLVADFDGDGSGAIAGSGTAIDMSADGVNRGTLGLEAASGVGSPGSPIDVADARDVSAVTSDAGGIHLRSVAGDGFSLVLAEIGAGDGDVEVTATDGDLTIAGDVTTPGDDMGAGGAVALGVTAPGAVLNLAAADLLISAAGPVTFDAPVRLLSPATVESGDDVAFTGTIDGTADPLRVQRPLRVAAEGVTRFGGDVGSDRPIRSLLVDGDVELAGDTSFAVEDVVSFGGALDASSDDAAFVSLSADESVVFGGDVGAAGRLAGLVVDSDVVAWLADDAQQVVTGDGGLALDPDGLPSPPADVVIAKLGGDLLLSSTGAVSMGPAQKLTVQGRLDLVGGSVTVGDVNALEIHVVSDDLRITAREPGPLLLASGAVVPDGGADLFANVIETSSAPTAEGAGPPPRFATLSGAVDGAGAGALQTSALDAPIAAGDLVSGPLVLDLGFRLGDPGNQTERREAVVLPNFPPLPGDDPGAGSALPPDAASVLAFLRCVDRDDADAAACAPARSALDSPRGEEIRRRYRRLLGDAPEARAARRLLARDPGSPAARAVLRDLATLLIQIRLLGIDEREYEALRGELLAALRAGADGPDGPALLDAIRAQGRGVPL